MKHTAEWYEEEVLALHEETKALYGFGAVQPRLDLMKVLATLAVAAATLELKEQTKTCSDEMREQMARCAQ